MRRTKNRNQKFKQGEVKIAKVYLRYSTISLEEPMDKEAREHKQFLEQQLNWCKKQDRILEEIERKLHEMKKIAQYTLDHELSAIEIEQLNSQLNALKREVHFLEKQLQSVVH